MCQHFEIAWERRGGIWWCWQRRDGQHVQPKARRITVSLNPFYNCIIIRCKNDFVFRTAKITTVQ